MIPAPVTTVSRRSAVIDLEQATVGKQLDRVADAQAIDGSGIAKKLHDVACGRSQGRSIEIGRHARLVGNDSPSVFPVADVMPVAVVGLAIPMVVSGNDALVDVHR